MDQIEYPNPYAPPSAGIDFEAPRPEEQGAPLAERLTRLGASIIDNLVAMGPVFIAGIIGLIISISNGKASGVFGDPENPAPPDVVFQQFVPALLGLAVGGLASLGVGIFQCYRIATTGQSLAKKWLNIRIVNLDGSPVNFGSGVGMRAILPWFIGCIPYIGSIFALVDILMIFRDDRRCLHDLMAGTKVVVALPRD
jgi:uncharacterized RDD family membrane protein YckC